MPRTSRSRPVLTLVLLSAGLLALLWMSSSSLRTTPCRAANAPQPNSATVAALNAKVASLESEVARLVHRSPPPPLPTEAVPTVTPCPSVVATAQQPTPSLAPKAANAAESELPWLLIVIPTVPRPKKALLLPTLASIARQIKHTQFVRRVKVVVMNQRPGKHDVFAEAAEKYRDEPWAEFVENDHKVREPPQRPVEAEFASRHQEAPSPAVLRQTLDVVALLRHVSGQSEYVLLYEDDFHLCEGGLVALQYMIDKAHIYADGTNHWSAIRCGFGLSGIILQNGGEGGASNSDVDAFADYLLKHCHRRPPDHLAVEFYAKESSEARSHFDDRGVFAFRYNVARHDGRVSTLREQEAWSTPGCFTELVAPQVFPVEAWNADDCPKDDLWPCPKAFSRPVALRWIEGKE